MPVPVFLGFLLRWSAAAILLPFNVLVIIPGATLLAFRHTRISHAWSDWGSPAGIITATLGLAGLALALWSVGLFMRFGQGTAAPWDPPKRFILRGPYRYVRNPMLMSIFIMQLAEAIFSHSWPLYGWLTIFIAANLIYIPYFEEPGLKKRFGPDYLQYKRSVPRWLPKLKPGA
ncbi:MAG: methyltransferase [Elusimicrobiota bacterium]|jgi:protein-S-isoprenylcysteine O-methyltransferase Ste14